MSKTLKDQIGGSHYRDRKIQPIEFIQDNELTFCEGNVVKYVTRHRYKDGAQDLKKLLHYAALELEHTYGITATTTYDEPAPTMSVIATEAPPRLPQREQIYGEVH